MNQSLSQVKLPSAESVRAQIVRVSELWLGAMFLKHAAYAYERERKNPLGNGLVYLAVIGVLVALAGILGAGLRFATAPSLDAIKNTVLVHLQAMPFFNNFSLAGQDSFLQTYNRWWDQFGTTVLGYPGNEGGVAALGLTLLTTPLGLIIGWFIYGALVHLVARGWNPETSFSEMLAPLALASSPQLLSVLTLFPGTGISGAVIALWTFICNVVAIRVAYNTTTRRAIWGALFPILLLVVLLLLLGCAALALLVPVIRTIGGAQ